MHQWTLKGKRELTTSDQDLAFTVNGMTCSHCKESVESAIFSFDAVRDTVDLATGGVIISGIDLDENAIKEKISRSRIYHLKSYWFSI